MLELEELEQQEGTQWQLCRKTERHHMPRLCLRREKEETSVGWEYGSGPLCPHFLCLKPPFSSWVSRVCSYLRNPAMIIWFHPSKTSRKEEKRPFLLVRARHWAKAPEVPHRSLRQMKIWQGGKIKPNLNGRVKLESAPHRVDPSLDRLGRIPFPSHFFPLPFKSLEGILRHHH